MCNETTSGPVPVPEEKYLLRDHLDKRIESARREVLLACEAKAKAEFLGLLDAPWEDMRNIVGW